MIWATKQVHSDTAASIEALFRDQVAWFDPGKQMLLIRVDQEWPLVRLWVCVPDYDLLKPYYEFAYCRRTDLPAAPLLIVGCSERFGAIFHGRRRFANLRQGSLTAE